MPVADNKDSSETTTHSRFQRLRRQRVTAFSAVDEMNVVSLGDRGNEAGDLRRFLSKDAPIGELLRPG